MAASLAALDPPCSRRSQPHRLVWGLLESGASHATQDY
jgi:hypothetical protein